MVGNYSTLDLPMSVLTKLGTKKVERMLANFDNAFEKTALRCNFKKTMFTRNGLVSDASFTLTRTDICERYRYT